MRRSSHFPTKLLFLSICGFKEIFWVLGVVLHYVVEIQNSIKDDRVTLQSLLVLQSSIVPLLFVNNNVSLTHLKVRHIFLLPCCYLLQIHILIVLV